jgi:hypothetical protein
MAEKQAAVLPPGYEGLTFEKVWAMFEKDREEMRETGKLFKEQVREINRLFKETDRQFKETDRQFRETDRQFKETDRQFKETDRKFQETDRQFKETDRKFQETDRQFKETDRQLKETDRKISQLGDRIGELVEHLMSANIVEKFNRLGYAFGRVNPNARFFDVRHELVAEVDMLLENGDVALAVEVKTKLTTNDIAGHVDRMKRVRRYADEHGDRRRLIGAVAGAIMSDGAKRFALKKGFYVIEQSGEAVKIDAPDGFKPREW